MRQVLDAAGFPIICDQCGEMQRYEGTRRKQVIVCGCLQPDKKPRRCSPKSTKRKGRSAEIWTEKFFRGIGYDAQSTVGSGAAGSRTGEKRFDTDVVIRLADALTFGVESKRHRNIPMATFVKMMGRSEVLRLEEDADVAKAKKYPGRVYWFATDTFFAEMAKWAAEGVRAANRGGE